MSVISKSHLLQFRNRTRTFSKGINESLSEFKNESKTEKITIFLSHKHDEIEELDAAISLLKSFGVIVYVDWEDDGMPQITGGKTATRIKLKIKENKKFIFLATEGAIASKWCNWELGYGDSLKYSEKIALLPIRKDYYNYTGTEYMKIYSSIEYLDGTIKASDGTIISEGYYVLEPADKDGNRPFMTLKYWLQR